MIQVWVNKDDAANAAAWTVKLEALVEKHSGGRDLGNAEILDLLRGIVVFVDEGRRAEAEALCKKNKIEHCGVVYLPTKKRDESLGGYGIPKASKNVVFVSYEEALKAVFVDLSPKEFEKVVKAYEAVLEKK